VAEALPVSVHLGEAPAQIRRALLKVCFPLDTDRIADILAGPSRAMRRHWWEPQERLVMIGQDDDRTAN
jgi:hypothetical protein